MNNRIYRRIPLLIILSALAGMALVFYATSLGPGVGGDATIYLTSAKNFSQGKGLGWMEADGSFRLLPYTPPFYPLVLSVAGLFGDITGAARALNILLFGGTVVLVGFAFARFTGSAWFAALLSGLVALSPVLLGVQVWAMSEPLFLFLGFCGLFVLLHFLETRRRWSLIASALLFGLAFLTRYMGLAFVATGGLALFLIGKGYDGRLHLSISRREIREAVLFGILSLLPVLVWFILDISLTGTVGSRSGQLASAYWQRFLDMGPALQKIILFWLIPDSLASRLPAPAQSALWLVPLVFLGFLLVLVGARASSALKHRSAPGEEPLEPASRASLTRMAWLFGLFILVYLVVLAAAQVFTYPPITLASRMLSPVHLAVLVWLPVILLLALQVLAPRSRLAAWLVSIGLCVLALTYGARSILIAQDYHRAGIGYLSLSWRNSLTIEALQKIPPEVPLISNEVTAIMFLAGRPAYALQEIYQNHPLEPFTVYGSGEDESQRVFREQSGALVLFGANLREDFAVYGDQIDERLAKLTSGLYQYHDSDDGAIYFSERPGFMQPGK